MTDVVPIRPIESATGVVAPTDSGPRPGRAPRWNVAYALALGLIFALPGLFVLLRTVELGADLGPTLGQAMAPLGRTVLLASTVSLTTCVVGTAMAWLVVRSDLPGRRIWRVLLVLPLVLPSFVGAAAFLASLAPGGLLYETLGLVGAEPPRLRGFWPSWALLTMFTYPYVLLPVGARLTRLRPGLEESARLLGSSPLRAVLTVTVPQLRSSILASGLLVFLYTVSEFGAVQLLGYDTLTRSIFATRLVDRASSFTLAAVLIFVALLVVGAERRARIGDRVDDRARSRPSQPLALGRWRPVALVVVAGAVGASLIAPVISLATWGIRGLADGRVDVAKLAGPALNTAVTGVAASLVSLAAVVPLARLLVRYRSRLGRLASVAVVSGFAVPGLVIALALVFWTLNTSAFGWLYQTWPLLLVAYAIHFGSQALGSAEAAIRAVPEQLRESGRLLEPSRTRRLVRVEAPLMRPGLVAGGGLVLLSTIKELPATLLLAPIGFDTLATEIWGGYEDGFYAEVGVASLVLIALSALLTWWLILAPADLD